MTTAALLLAAFCCLGTAGLIDTLVRSVRPVIRRVPYLVIATAGVLVAIAGFRADLGHGGTLDLGTTLGFGHSRLRADQLAGLFLAVVGVVATPVALGFADWARRAEDVPRRMLAATTALTLASVMVVILADDAYVFLFGWEGVSIAFYFLAGYQRERRRSNQSMLTFAFSKASGGFLLLGFGLLFGSTGSFSLSAWSGVGGATHAAAYGLLLAGFMTKVGVVPLQIWMPHGYAAAPGPARALMSAIAANIGFYGMWRIFGVLGAPPTWMVIVLLLLAALTALLGIAHAAVQRDLQRVIASSSVENGGLITAGFAIALGGATAGLPGLTAVGLLAASLQLIAHAFAKSSLFLATGSIEQQTGTSELDEIRGIGRELPAAGTAFTIGALTLAGLPLTLGFVSEWFLLESVMQLFRLHDRALQMAFAVAGALIALAIGFAGFAFVRLVGLTILGRLDCGARVRPLGRRMPLLRLLAFGLPASGCIAIAAISPWEIRFIAHGLAPLVPVGTTTGALKEPWVLQPVYGAFSALSPSWLAVELPVLFVAVVAMTFVLTRGSFLRVRRVPAWRSATPGVEGEPQYTPFGFANATRHVLANVLLSRSSLADFAASATQTDASAFLGPDMPPGEAAAPEGAGTRAYESAGATYNADVIEVVETFVYRPLIQPLRRLVATAKRLQSGRLDAYIAYMLIALVALLAAVVGLS